MIEALGKWIISICVAIFFATAVQMILPDNSIKKYCNFVLGLIVFVVMITPIIEYFNSGLPVTQLIDESANYVFGETDREEYKDYRDQSIMSAVDTFKKNLDSKCEEDLKKQFGGRGYDADFTVSYDEENTAFNIDKVEISVEGGLVRKVKKVQIGEDAVSVGNSDDDLGKEGSEIRNYISSKYDIDESVIYVYKSDGTE